MDSSKFGFGVFVGFVLLLALSSTTIRESLHLTQHIANDANPISVYYSEQMLLPGKTPWLRQERKRITIANSTEDLAIGTGTPKKPQILDRNRITVTNDIDDLERHGIFITNTIEDLERGTGTRKKPLILDRRLRLRWMDNVTHFFSHIPKSGTEYAHRELLHLLQSTVRLPDNRTIKSVRAAQKRFNETSYEGDFLISQPKYEYKNFPIPVDTTGETDGYTPPMICNQGTTEFSHLAPYHVVHYARYRCDFFVSERHWNPVAQNVYTIVREPFSHVLSQYFHCTESRDHKRLTDRGENRHELMPPLNEWLKLFADFTGLNFSPKELHDHTKSLKERFSCYDPIESESEFTKFDHKLPKDYTYPYPYTNDHGDRDEKTKQLDKVLFDDLKQRYRIIGDTSQMVKSVCAIFIAYTDGKHIPETCDCTNPRVSESNSSQFLVHSLWMDPKIERYDDYSFKIKMGYNADDHSHGVKNHGSAFLKELPQDQLDLIVKLRRKDMVLYNVSRAVFAEQVKDMETMYGIKVCDQWNRPKQPPEAKSERWRNFAP